MSLMRQMWFGTRQYCQWIKVHSPGSGYESMGYSERLEYLNGGLGVRTSFDAHRELTLTWNAVREEEARTVSDYAFGQYGTGYVYLVDPVSAGLNALNRQWAAPGLATMDAPPLAGDERPQRVPNANQAWGYPADMAQYTVAIGDQRRTFFTPIPPGHVAWVGVHGDPASSLGIAVQAVSAGVNIGSPTIVPVSGVNSATRVTHQFSPAGQQRGIELSIEDGDGTITLAGVVVQILPAGVAPKTGRFISGQGQGGMTFEDKPLVTPSSLIHNQYGMSVKLAEVEPWE